MLRELINARTCAAVNACPRENDQSTDMKQVLKGAIPYCLVKAELKFKQEVASSGSLSHAWPLLVHCTFGWLSMLLSHD